MNTQLKIALLVSLIAAVKSTNNDRSFQNQRLVYKRQANRDEKSVFNIAINSRKIFYLGVKLYGVASLNNKVYFGTQHGTFYEYSPVNNHHKLVAYIGDRDDRTNINAVIAFKNKIFFGSQNSVLYAYDPATGNHKDVAKVDADILSLAARNDDVYIGTLWGSLYVYNEVDGKTKKVVAVQGGGIIWGMTAFNNKIYFGSSNDNLYEYDIGTGHHKKVASTKGDIYSVTNHNNKVYFGSEDRQFYEYNPQTDQSRMVAKIGDDVYAALPYGNKIFLGSEDDHLYEFNTDTGETKKLVFTNENVNSLTLVNDKLYLGLEFNNLFEYDIKENKGKVIAHLSGDLNGIVALDNKLYIGTEHGSLYQYDPANERRRRVVFIATGVGDDIYELATANNKVYFGAQDDNLYEYDPKTDQHKKVAYVNADIYGLTSFNDTIYYGTLFGNLYKYTPATGENKFINNVGRNYDYVWGLASFKNKIYFGTRHGELYEHDPANGQGVKKIASAGAGISEGITALNNKIYFGSLDHKLYEYDTRSGTQKIVAELDKEIHEVAVLNNKVYFGAYDGKLHVYNPATRHHKAVSDVGSDVRGLVAFNNKLYFGTTSEDLHEYYEEVDLRGVIANHNLNKIKNTDDKTILNELIYQNPNLDLNVIYLVDKTRSSAKIKAKDKNNKYTGEKEIFFKVDKDSDEVVVLTQLIKRGIFLVYKDENDGQTVKVRRVNMDGLTFSNVLATKENTPKYNRKIKSICFGTTTLSNNSPKKQVLKTPHCKYTKETVIRAQILRGFTKQENTKSRTPEEIYQLGGDEWPFTSATDDQVASEFKAELSTGEYGDYGIWNLRYDSSDTRNLSSNFDFSNLQTKIYRKNFEVELPSQEIELSPQNQIKLTASLEERTGRVNVNLKQTIRGDVEAQAMNAFNEKLLLKMPIKKVMMKLKEYDLLPDEISINNDDSVSFNGVAEVTLTKKLDASVKLS